ncbi:MAG TPA: MBL fold metallo-hydrolase [Chromatiales bacterium]|nr:MBL fold metallo-hydrolase [Chromatiales bacterium]
MHIHFSGACQEVTGSCHLLEVNGRRVLLDCGLFQGSRQDEERNRAPFPFDPRSIDALILSHAHIDHSGRIPLLVQQGFRGPVYCQEATVELCEVMLKDAAYLNEKDAEWENRKRERKGLRLVEPLYTMQDAQASLGQFVGVPYDRSEEILPGIHLRFVDAGHILGSTIVELTLREAGWERRLVFSGDLGHQGMPLMRDVTLLRNADLVLMESTYGDRLHRSWQATWEELGEVLTAARSEQGNILIPAFAVDRSQELLFEMSRHIGDWGLDDWQIFLDSPMAITVTGIYLKYIQLLDPAVARELKALAGKPLLPHFRFTRTPEESMSINRIRNGALIIAASGMCSGGRIMHHLKHNAWRRETHIIIIGYQARGTIGRALVDGAAHIRLWGETIRVQARVHTIGGLSAHADQAGLMHWYGNFRHRPPLVLVHGEPETQQALARAIRKQFQAKVTIAEAGMVIDLADV